MSAWHKSRVSSARPRTGPGRGDETGRTLERDVDVLCGDDLARDDLLVLAQVERREVDAELAERLLGLGLGLLALALGRVHLVHDDLQERETRERREGESGSALFRASCAGSGTEAHLERIVEQHLRDLCASWWPSVSGLRGWRR